MNEPIAGDLLQSNGELAHKTRTLTDILRHIKTRESCTRANYNLFLGAGSSVSSGIKTASNLIDEWTCELFERYKGRKACDPEEARGYFEEQHGSWYNPLNPYSSLFEKKYDLQSQRRRFVESEVADKLPSIGYAYLVNLVCDSYFDSIFTTNFDDLINEAFYQFSNARPITCAHDSSIRSISVTSNRPKVIKLHGDYLFDDIRSTLRETESLEQNTKDKLIEFCKEYGLVVLGYSGSDRSVMDVLEFLCKQENYLTDGIYWCLRKSDRVNQSLRNLFWREKVYPVLVDGFDETMAFFHNKVNDRGLEIGNGSRELKLNTIVREIIRDKCNLSENATIKRDIIKLKKDEDKQEISSLLNENEDNFEISLEDYKNILEIEKHIKSKNLRGAYDFCKASYEACKNDNAKPNYLYRLIAISDLLDDHLESLQWCDKLILCDVNYEPFLIKKSRCIKDLRERYKYLKELSEKYVYQNVFLNELALAGFEIINNRPKTDIVSVNEIMEHLRKSLLIDPSLSNGAWAYLMNCYIFKYGCSDVQGREDILKEMNSHVSEAESINPYNIKALEIKLTFYKVKKDIGGVVNCARGIIESYKISSKGKQAKFNSLLDEYLAICGFDSSVDADNENLKSIRKMFYEDHLVRADYESNPDLLISLAEYYYDQKCNRVESEKFYRQALLSENVGVEITKLIQNSSWYTNDYSEELTEKLDEVKSRLSKKQYASALCALNMLKKKYIDAIKNIEYFYELGGDLGSYLSQCSFAYLALKDYNSVISLQESFRADIQESDSLEVFKINYQYALKKQGDERFDEVCVRNLSAQSKSMDVQIAAYLILDNIQSAKRKIKDRLSVRKSYYYVLRSWQILDLSILEECIEKYKMNFYL